MPTDITPISYIRIGENDHPIDAITVGGKTLADLPAALPSLSNEDEEKIMMVLQGQWSMTSASMNLYNIINGLPCPGGDSGDSDSDSGEHDYPNEYLTFEVLTPGNIAWKSNGTVAQTIQYSKNNGEWTSITAAATPVTIPVVAGDVVRFKGTNSQYGSSKDNFSGFGDTTYATATYNISGNIMSLLYGDNFQGQTTITKQYAFFSLFDGSGVVSAENLILPTMTMVPHCYRALFANCLNLTTAPQLPATTLASSCYRFMFDNDTNLTTPPDLPATTLQQESYYGLFHMCSSLHYIRCMATDISALNSTKQWVEGLPKSGVFVKDINMYGFEVNNINGIPIGWTVTEEGTLIVEDPLVDCFENAITIQTVTPDSTAYYRLNQTGQYQVYLGPIDIVDDTFIEVYATKNGTNSNTVTRTFIYVEPEGADSDSGDSDYEGSEVPVHDYSKDYLTFDILSPGTILWKAYGSGATKTIQYSLNGGAWTSITSTTSGVSIPVAKNDVLRFKGTETQYCNGNKSNYSGFDAGTASFNVSGNIMSMLAGDNFVNANTLPTTYTFTQFFKLSLVVSAEHLILPPMSLTQYCYRAMFSKCSNLTVAPELPATTLATGCYYYMFEDCAFETAPVLPATSLATTCYYYMFTGCANLNYIKCFALNHQSGQVDHWVNGVAAEGTFVKNPDETWTTGISGIPTGWVVYNIGEEPTEGSEEEETYSGPYPALAAFRRGETEITLPYSINATDGQTSNYAKSSFNFFSEIYLDEVQPTYLWFDHADQSADIYIDNVKADTHWGGYTSFFSDITEYVHTGKNNLKVVLNNTTRQTLAPCDADFNFNATLGKVELLSSPVLPPVEYGYDGFRIRATVTDASAAVTVTTSVPTTATVVLTIDDGTFHYTDTVTDTGDITFTTTIQNPHLWGGKPDPHLYDFTIDIYKDNVLYHTFTRPYGFRYYRYAINDTTVLQSGDPYTGFLLNGQPYLLRGVCMHQDIQGKANALTSADIAHDFDIITELGANFIRTAHYPHPREFYDWCDRLGIVVQTEAPWVNKAQSTQPTDYYTHLASQITDMVLQHYNHPSIIFWGLANEIKTDDANFTKGKINEYTTLIKSYDNERLVGYVLAESSSNALATFNYPSVDWVGHNIYVGWYSSQNSNNPTSAINTRLNNGINNNVAVGYSEYGCGGNINCHSVDPLTTTTRGNNPRHDIEYQMWLHEGQIAAIKNFPQLAFTSEWVLFDFAVSKRNEGYITCADGETEGPNDDTNRYLNDKGLVCRDHTTKKDTFYLYKAWWNPTSKFVHICQKNYIKNADRVIKCYTNDPDNGELSLYVNGTFIETATVTNDIATFTAMDFDLGDVVRVDGANTSDTFTFTTIATELSSESDD